MTRRLFGLAAIAYCFALTGCGSGNSAEAEKTMNESIATMKALTAAIESGDKAKVKELSKKHDELSTKCKTITVTASEKKRLDDKTKVEYEQAMQKLFDAMSKAISSGKMTANDFGTIEGPK